MPDRLCLLFCAPFQEEISAFVQTERFPDVTLTALPMECGDLPDNWMELRNAVQSCRKRGQSVVILAGECLGRPLRNLDSLEGVQVLKAEHCSEWLTDKSLLDKYRQDGACILTPGWIKSWKPRIKKLGLGKKEIRSTFGDAVQKLVLLDTGLHPRIDKAFLDLAHDVRLPAETVWVGLGYFRQFLARTILEWRLSLERSRAAEKTTDLRRELDAYSAADELMGSLIKARGESEAVDKIVEHFAALFAPRRVSFCPMDEERAEIADAGRGAAPGEAEGIARLVEMNQDYAWLDGEEGFLLRIGAGSETLGVVIVSGAPSRPGQKDHDLHLALGLARAAGLAISNIRALARVEEERDKARIAEAALRQSEEQARSIFQGLPVGIYRTTPDGRIVDANLALAKMLGYPDADSLKYLNTMNFYFSLQDRDIWQSLMESNGVIDNFETQLRRADGRIIWIRDTARAVKDRRGQIVYFEGTLEDITKRKQAETGLAWEYQVHMAIAATSSKLLTPAPIEEVSSLVLEYAKRLTRSRFGFVGYIDKASGSLISQTMTRDIWEYCQVRENSIAVHGFKGLWGWVLANKKPLLTNAPRIDPRSSGVPAGHIPIEQFLGVPALIDGSLVGIVALANPENNYGEPELDVIERLATLYAIAIHRMRAEEQLRELSLVDELTQLLNRRGFLTLAEQQLKVSHRNKKEMYLLYADIDKMKDINDNHGHSAGDLALKDVSSVLRESFRESDIVARIGGDEFVALIIDAKEGTPSTASRRIQEKLDALNAQPERKSKISLSLGFSRYDPEHPSSIQDLITEADRKMYGDKSGRTPGNSSP